MTDPAGGPLEAAALEHLFEITGGDQEFFDELIDTYLDDGVAQLAAMRAAADAGDPAALLRPAHTLKSSSANVGAVDLAEQCRTLEADARAGTVPDMAARVAACESAFAAVRAALLALREGR
jgi:HPt (histidine-containing phosphotransfer) domain-containing protein